MRLQNTAFFQTVTSATDASPSGTALDGNQSAAAATFSSAGMFVGDALGFMVFLKCPATGSPDGTLKIEGSIDRSANNEMTADNGITNWFTLATLDPRDGTTTNTSFTVSNANTSVGEIKQSMVRFVRVTWTKSNGSITLTAKLQKKGVG